MLPNDMPEPQYVPLAHSRSELARLKEELAFKAEEGQRLSEEMENGGEELQRRQQEHQAMMEEMKTRGSKDREALQRRHEEEVSDVYGVCLGLQVRDQLLDIQSICPPLQ